MAEVSNNELAQPAAIRHAYGHDARELAELHLRSALTGFAHIFPPEAPVPDLGALIKHWTETVRNDGLSMHACFVAVSSTGGIVGTVVAGPAPTDATRGHLSRLYVDPTEWGRGIGRLLYGAALGHLQSTGFQTATLSVLEANQRARAWYERLGWRPTSERISVYEPAGVADVVYTITL